MIQHKEKTDNAIVCFLASEPFVLGGLTITSNWRLLSFGVATALIAKGAYNLKKENEYSIELKSLNKKYQINLDTKKK